MRIEESLIQQAGAQEDKNRDSNMKNSDMLLERCIVQKRESGYN